MFNFYKHKAILIIHGFIGGTYDEEELASYLELNRKYDVFQFTLPGHERNLSKVKYDEWITSSEEKVKWLINNGYDTIYLIGHSMGGVIASYLATKYKQVKKLVLAAPAFEHFAMENNGIKLGKTLKGANKLVKTYGTAEIISRMLKLDISALKEFTSLINEYHDYIKSVTCPILVLQGLNDNLVPLSSSEFAYKNALSKEKLLIYLEGATHDMFKMEKSYDYCKIVGKFLNNSLKGGIYTI